MKHLLKQLAHLWQMWGNLLEKIALWTNRPPCRKRNIEFGLVVCAMGWIFVLSVLFNCQQTPKSVAEFLARFLIVCWPMIPATGYVIFNISKEIRENH